MNYGTYFTTDHLNSTINLMNPERNLLTEDNGGGIILKMEALEEGKAMTKISTAGEGDPPIQFLHKEGVFTQPERPGLILPDINLPRINRKEAPTYIKVNPKLKATLVIKLKISFSQKLLFNLIKIKPIVKYQNQLARMDFLNWFNIFSISVFQMCICAKTFNNATQYRC